MTRRIALLCALTFILAAFCLAQTPNALLHSPSANRSQVVFTCGDDIWSAPRSGGDARPLTTGSGVKATPTLSPDGEWIAFSGTYEGNTDVYVMPASGGEPRRLTHHPGADVVLGWSPDSKQVLFRSARNSYAGFSRLFTVGLSGGLPHEIALPEGDQGSFSADGSHLAYVPVTNWSSLRTAWKRYRGGRTARIWIADLKDSSTIEIPRDNSNDFDPMWIGDKIYFLSDRNGPVSLFAYDTRTKKVDQLLSAKQDIKSASASAGAIVYEQMGSLHVFDVASAKSGDLNVRVAGDLPGVRPHFLRVADQISAYNISPTGARAVFGAHGEVLTVPAEKGDIRNLTNTSGAAERDPAWSPDGKWIAYFSDESGEYELHLKPQDGMGAAKKINLGSPASFFYDPIWSPDSKKIAYTDKRLNLWYVDLANAKPVKVATDYYEDPESTLNPAWSPDSRWLTYSKHLPTHMHAVFIYSIESSKENQVTDGLSDARWPVFDKNGKYLYFTASTDSGPTSGWLDLSILSYTPTRAVYIVVLKKDQASPLAPESDEEKGSDAKPDTSDKPSDHPAMAMSQEPQQQPAGESPAAKGEAKPDAAKPAKVTVAIDFDGIDQRILALPLPVRNYIGLQAGAAGTLFVGEASNDPSSRFGGAGRTVSRFELSVRRAQPLLTGVRAFVVSADGKKMLYSQGGGAPGGPGTSPRWLIASVPPPSRPGEPAPGEGGPAAAAAGPRVTGQPIAVDNMQVWVDPRAEWKQEYHEVWRIERDFLYDPNLHGLNWKTADKQYEPYLAAIANREDLSYVFNDMLGEISIGHMFITAPRETPDRAPRTGLLGADYRVVNGRYQFAKIYQGENWNPGLRAPLTEPGVNVKQGEYLLDVNGRELKGSDEIFELFQGTAGKQVLLKVGADPSGKGARTVTVVPVDSEQNLRNREWMDQNRRRVDELSGGKVAYVYLPNTSVAGYTNFNRYYFAQLGREGTVVDERFNGGGSAADYIIDHLRRPLMNYWTTREGHDFTTPTGSIYGPKAMVTNMYAGSGGDALPWYFKHEKLGPLVGTRTWGGLVGIYDYPELMDTGGVTAPRVAFYNPDGDWDVENHGVAPDVEVPFSPKAWREGHDPQLERAIQLVMEQINKTPQSIAKRPAYPNYHKGDPLSVPPEGIPAAGKGNQ
jgi:tricorn protease